MRVLLCVWLAGNFLTCHALGTSGNAAWSVHSFQADSGLPNDNVTGLTQTDDGFLWVANHGRLARFDGAEFEEFATRSIVQESNDRISRLLGDGVGGLWLAVDRGPVVHLNSGNARIITDGLPGLNVGNLVLDAQGSLWVSYFNGGVCRIKDGVVTRFSGANGLPAGYFCSLTPDSRGTLWFAIAGQVGIFKDDRFESLFTVPHAKTRVLCSASGELWICSGNRIFRYNEDRGLSELGQIPAQSAGTGPNVIREDRSGALWIGTSDSGLYRFDTNGIEKIPTSHRTILSLFEDREANIWAGTGGGGLNRITRRAVTLENVETGLPFETIQSLAEDVHGAVWAVTENGLLVRRGKSGWSIVSTNSGWPQDPVTCVAADKSGGIWIGTGNYSLLAFRDKRLSIWNRTNGLAMRSIAAITVGRNGDVWIAGDGPPALQKFSAGEFTSFPLPPGTSRIGVITEDFAGNIWAGSSRGTLIRITDGRLFDHTSLAPPRSIRSLHATKDGTMWIGYAGAGLGRLKDGKLARVTASEGLFDNYISQIMSDEAGWLWFGANRGLFKVWPSTLADVAEGRDAGIHSIHYGRGEGLPGLQANHAFSPGALRTRDGRVWIPMRTGIAIADPLKLREDRVAPVVLLKRVVVDDRTVAFYGGVAPVRDAIDPGKPGGRLRLEPGHRRLDFAFTALSFHYPENVAFRYKLEGFDDNWIWPGSQRHVSYSRLPAGKYRFLVSGSNGDGVWNQHGTSFAFTVVPFFWQTWWFRTSISLGFLAITIAIVRYASFRRLRARLITAERQAALERERSRIARDIHDDMGSRLTKIVLLSELTLKEPATHEQAAERAREVGSAAREVMKSLDETVWAINPRNDTLRDLLDYISQFAVDFLQTANIRCRVESPARLPDRAVPADVRHNLFLASKEALNNLVRHAQATEARVRVSVDERQLNIVIEDDGRGFEQTAVNGSGDGLRNMRHRLEELGGHCDISSRPGAGTLVRFIYNWN